MAQTAQATEWQPPTPLRSSVAMDALRPFLFTCTWTGTVAADGMGPGSPQMNAVGRATFTTLMDGAWLAGDFEQDQFVDGVRRITWKAHYVVGWHPDAREYRITYVDNTGSMSQMRGRVEGKQFVNETFHEEPVQLRMAWTWLEPGLVNWRNECSIEGGPWFLVEEYVCTWR